MTSFSCAHRFLFLLLFPEVPFHTRVVWSLCYEHGLCCGDEFVHVRTTKKGHHPKPATKFSCVLSQAVHQEEGTERHTNLYIVREGKSFGHEGFLENDSGTPPGKIGMRALADCSIFLLAEKKIANLVRRRRNENTDSLAGFLIFIKMISSTPTVCEFDQFIGVDAHF